MKIKELIRKLEIFNPEAEVVVAQGRHNKQGEFVIEKEGTPVMDIGSGEVIIRRMLE